MMPFAEKLTFLMHICQTGNKDLAQELGVDPSMVSLMRTGKRRLSKDPAMAEKMGLFFARRCSAPFQRQALAETLGQLSISPSMPITRLAAILSGWLRGEGSTLADSILSAMEEPPAPVTEPAGLPVPSPGILADEGRTSFSFGVEGRQESFAQVIQACRQLAVPGTILIVVDDNLEWLLHDYALSRKAQSQLLELVERGFTIRQIVPPANYINSYADSLQFWLPLYATGKARTYYYPRLRGNLYRHSIVVVPGCCVQYASAVGLNNTSEVTMFSTNPKLVQAFEKQFQDYVALCRPALNAHVEYPDILSSHREYCAMSGSSIQLTNGLSMRSMPRELVNKFSVQAAHPLLRELLQTFQEDAPLFEARLAQERAIDMCYLSSEEEIRSGRINLDPADKLWGQVRYTAEDYCLHLKHILYLLDTYENYFFIPLSKQEYPDFDLLVNEAGMALIVRTTKPLVTLDIRRQPLVVAFQEHLLRRADAEGFGSAHKDRVRKELRSLIQRLSAPRR